MGAMDIHRIVLRARCATAVQQDAALAAGKMKTVRKGADDAAGTGAGSDVNPRETEIFGILGNDPQTVHIVHVDIVQSYVTARFYKGAGIIPVGIAERQHVARVKRGLAEIALETHLEGAFAGGLALQEGLE